MIFFEDKFLINFNFFFIFQKLVHVYFLIENQKIFRNNYQFKIIDVST